MKTRKRTVRNVHRDLQKLVVPGGLFDVEPSELDLNVGRKCRVKIERSWPGRDEFHQDGYWCYGHWTNRDGSTSWKPSSGYAIDGYETFTITCVQKNYKGKLVYRVVGDHEKEAFGMCAAPSAVEFIS